MSAGRSPSSSNSDSRVAEGDPSYPGAEFSLDPSALPQSKKVKSKKGKGKKGKGKQVSFADEQKQPQPAAQQAAVAAQAPNPDYTSDDFSVIDAASLKIFETLQEELAAQVKKLDADEAAIFAKYTAAGYSEARIKNDIIPEYKYTIPPKIRNIQAVNAGGAAANIEEKSKQATQWSIPLVRQELSHCNEKLVAMKKRIAGLMKEKIKREEELKKQDIVVQDLEGENLKRFKTLLRDLIIAPAAQKYLTRCLTINAWTDATYEGKLLEYQVKLGSFVKSFSYEGTEGHDVFPGAVEQVCDEKWELNNQEGMQKMLQAKIKNSIANCLRLDLYSNERQAREKIAAKIKITIVDGFVDKPINRICDFIRKSLEACGGSGEAYQAVITAFRTNAATLQACFPLYDNAKLYGDTLERILRIAEVVAKEHTQERITRQSDKKHALTDQISHFDSLLQMANQDLVNILQSRINQNKEALATSPVKAGEEKDISLEKTCTDRAAEISARIETALKTYVQAKKRIKQILKNQTDLPTVEAMDAEFQQIESIFANDKTNLATQRARLLELQPIVDKMITKAKDSYSTALVEKFLAIFQEKKLRLDFKVSRLEQTKLDDSNMIRGLIERRKALLAKLPDSYPAKQEALRQHLRLLSPPKKVPGSANDGGAAASNSNSPANP